MPIIQEQLARFLRLLNTAAANYEGENFTALPGWFNHREGICDNWSNYTDLIAPDNRALWVAGRELLKARFIESGLDNTLTPFNDGIAAYQVEAAIGAIWFNERRREWLAKEVQYA